MNNPSELQSTIKAIRLYNSNESDCAFESGFLPAKVKLAAEYFFCQKNVEDYQKTAHPAPRRQYVVTLKGKLRFKVTNGDTFVLEPGIILIAEDLFGPGHSWELIEGDEWERIYIPFDIKSDSNFIAGDSK